MSKIQEIKQNLIQEINSSTPNHGLIISLSHELSKLEEGNKVRFTTDAGIINRLGKELVARQETAVVELIKNAYDADATYVDLIFYNTEEKGGILEIIDDGNGMNKQQLIDGFMRLSSTNKVRHPISPKYKRQRAGRKGIGRFSTQRLGSKLEIVTKQDKADYALTINIDWETFTPGQELILIENSVSKSYDPRIKEGTKLIISDLYEKWSDADIKRVFRYVADILQPFPVSKIKEENQDTDPGFNIGLFKSGDDDLELIADEENQILDYSLAVVEGSVNSSGEGSWRYSSRLYQLSDIDFFYRDKKGKKIISEALAGVKFKAYYFTQPQDEEVYPKNLKKHINNLLKEKGGIRLYRNGFRVPPYGHKGNDWLGLADSSARRKILPPHGNINWIGIVEIKDVDGNLFEEKSSREGLIENDSFKYLTDFLYDALVATAMVVATARDKKLLASQKDWDKDKLNPNPSVAIIEVADELDEIFKQEKKTKGKFSSEKERVHQQEKKEALLQQLSFFATRLIKENAMLRVLASTGITVSEFIHEVKQTIGAIEIDIQQLKNEIDENSKQHHLIVNLSKNANRFISYISYFDQSIRENITRNLKNIELGEVVHQFVESTKPLAQQRGIDLKCKVKGFDLFTIEMHESEWASILANLYSNSVKAIQRKGGNGQILISVYKQGELLFLRFEDNGDGIAENLSGDIFDPFVSISSIRDQQKFANDQSGLGLGLKIVRDILSSYGGDITVVSPSENYVTCFQIRIKRKQ